MKAYQGVLSRELVEGQFGPADIEARIKALLDYYGIPQENPDWASQLALALACAHVPGFRVLPRREAPETQPQSKARPRGRPRKRAFPDVYWLLMEFERLQDEMPDQGPYAICRRLSKDELFKEQGHTYNSIKKLLISEIRKPHIERAIRAESARRWAVLRRLVATSKGHEALLEQIDAAICIKSSSGFCLPERSKTLGKGLADDGLS